MSFHRRTLIQSFLPVYWFSYLFAISPFEIYLDESKQRRIKQTPFSLLKAFITILIMHVVFKPEMYMYSQYQELESFTSLVNITQMANIMIVSNIVMLVIACKQRDLVKFMKEVVDVDLRLQELGRGVNNAASRRMFLCFFSSSISITLFIEVLDCIIFKHYEANQFKFVQMYYLALLILNGSLNQFCCFVWILKKELDEVNGLMIETFAFIGKIPTNILRASKTVYYKDISNVLQVHLRICNVGRLLNSIYCLVNMTLIPCYLLSYANHIYYFVRRVNQNAVDFIEYFIFGIWTIFFYVKVLWLFYMCQLTKLNVGNIIFYSFPFAITDSELIHFIYLFAG